MAKTPGRRNPALESAGREGIASIKAFRPGSFPVRLAATECVLDTARYWTPYNVSGRVVKASIVMFAWSLTPGIETGNLILAPSDFPSQFLCMDNTRSGQRLSFARTSRSRRSSSLKAVIFRNHCFSLIFSTFAPDLQEKPAAST